jgi:hypothetical protein
MTIYFPFVGWGLVEIWLLERTPFARFLGRTFRAPESSVFESNLRFDHFLAYCLHRSPSLLDINHTHFQNRRLSELKV